MRHGLPVIPQRLAPAAGARHWVAGRPSTTAYCSEQHADTASLKPTCMNGAAQRHGAVQRAAELGMRSISSLKVFLC
jgi:hypothetical protein